MSPTSDFSTTPIPLPRASESCGSPQAGLALERPRPLTSFPALLTALSLYSHRWGRLGRLSCPRPRWKAGHKFPRLGIPRLLEGYLSLTRASGTSPPRVQELFPRPLSHQEVPGHVTPHTSLPFWDDPPPHPQSSSDSVGWHWSLCVDGIGHSVCASESQVQTVQAEASLLCLTGLSGSSLLWDSQAFSWSLPQRQEELQGREE